MRQLLRVADLDAFTTVLRLATGRTAQEENLSTLGGMRASRHPTVRSWLSVDLVAEAAGEVIGLEAKSGATIAPDFLPTCATSSPASWLTIRTSLRDSGWCRAVGRADAGHGVQVLPWSRVREVW